VLGFPCNQFGRQEPGTDEEIQTFATSKYNVNFQLFSKIEVNGEGACALYKWLKTAQPNADGSEDIPWNFTKFLVTRDGQCAKRFAPQRTAEELTIILPDYL